MQPINTLPFRNTPSQYVRHIMERLALRWCWILLIPLIFFAFLAFYRWQWIVVGLAVLFILYPFILSFVYFHYALSPEAQRFVRLMSLSFKQDGIDISYLKENKSKETHTNSKLSSSSPSYSTLNQEFLPFRKIESYSTPKGRLVLNFITPSYASLSILDTQWDTSINKTSKQDAITILEKNGIQFA